MSEEADRLRRLEELGARALEQKNYSKALDFYKAALSLSKSLYKLGNPVIQKMLEKKITQLNQVVEKLGELEKHSRRQSKHMRESAVAPSKGVSSLELPKKEVPKEEKLQLSPKAQKVLNELKDAVILERPTDNLSNIVGLKDIVQELEESIKWPILYPEEMKLLQATIRGVLLFGPPGCGKTHLIRCLAGEYNIPLIIGNPATIMSKYVGEAEKKTKQLFELASYLKPCIIFVDEVDKLLPKTASGSDAPKRVEGQFLQEMDGIGSNSGFVVVFATNDPMNLNPALIRPGRIDRIVFVPPPNFEARKKLFEINLRDIPLGTHVDSIMLAERTTPRIEGNIRRYYSGADIQNISTTIKRLIFRVWAEKGEVQPENSGKPSLPLNRRTPITRQLVEEALKTVPPSISSEMMNEYFNWAKKHASYLPFHEPEEIT